MAEREPQFNRQESQRRKEEYRKSVGWDKLDPFSKMYHGILLLSMDHPLRSDATSAKEVAPNPEKQKASEQLRKAVDWLRLQPAEHSFKNIPEMGKGSVGGILSAMLLGAFHGNERLKKWMLGKGWSYWNSIIPNLKGMKFSV